MVEIRDLVLRLPGVAPGDARPLAEEICRRLSDALPDWSLRRVPLAMDLRVRVPAGTPRAELPRVIAEQILRSLA